MRKCLLAMFEGDLSAKWSDPSYRYIGVDEMESAAIYFFEIWLSIFPKNSADRKRYVSGITGIQIALANVVLQLVKKYHLSYHDAIKKLSPLKRLCSWKHTDPLFSHLYDPAIGRIINHSRTTSITKTANKFIFILEKEWN